MKSSTTTSASIIIALIIKLLTTVSASAINRSRSNFLWSAEKQTSTSKSSSLARVVSSIAFARVSRLIAALLAIERITRSLTVVEMIREDLELSAIQRVLLDHLDTTISNLRDLSPDPLSKTFATFALGYCYVYTAFCYMYTAFCYMYTPLYFKEGPSD